MAACADLDFSCPVCLEVFKDPVVLSCSHSFCKACLQDWWTEKVTRECPVCKRRSSRTDPPCNLVLKNLCESFSQKMALGQSSVQRLCSQHNEKLQLFCLDHQQLVCLICRDSAAHHKHKFSPVDELAQKYRDKLRKGLEPLRDRLKKSREVSEDWDRVSEHIIQQGQHTERMIQKQFEQMRKFLNEEEQVRITAVRTEVQQKSSLMEQRRAALNQEIAALSESIGQTEKMLQDQDIPLLQNYSLKQVPRDHTQNIPELPSGSLVDVAKHLGNISLRIWNKMKELVSYSPVILDPNSAHPQLVVSDDLCGVQFKPVTNNKLPDNKERFNEYIMVQGGEGFSSGTHSWEVDIENNADWAVGVISEASQRKGEIITGFLDITFGKGKYTANASSLVEKLSLKQPLQKIRVNLDMDNGKVSFFDAQTNSHIYTFTAAFKDKMFPFINTIHPQNIRISPVNIQVQLQK